MAGNGSVTTTSASTDTLFSFVDKDRDYPHILFTIFCKIKEKLSTSNTLTDMNNEIEKIANSYGDVSYKTQVKDTHGNLAPLKVFEIKLVSLIGAKSVKSGGKTDIFLKQYFPGTDDDRKNMFAKNYPGDFNTFFKNIKDFVGSLNGQTQYLDDDIRIRFYKNTVKSQHSFIRIVSKDINDSNRSKSDPFNDAYHITIPYNPSYDIRPEVTPSSLFSNSSTPITNTFHLTREFPDISQNIHYYFTYNTLVPASMNAEELVKNVDGSDKPLGTLLASCITKQANVTGPSARTGQQTGVIGSRPQSKLGKKNPGGKRRTRRRTQRRRRTLRQL